MSQTVAPVPAPYGSDRARARNYMVDSQIRPVQVSDLRILAAMRDVPRERFAPAAGAAVAYADRAVDLGDGRVLMEPRIIARMLQVAVPRGGETALVLAASSGYASVLLARLGVRVTALEQNPRLAEWGAGLCAELAPTVRYERGTLVEGWRAGAPYDLILIDGGVTALPSSLSAQLAPGGRVVAVVSPPGKVGVAVLAEASAGGLRGRPQFDAATPLIPELGPAPSFEF